jgi:hypothetical protein
MPSQIMTNQTLYELCMALGIIPDNVERVKKFILTAEVGELPELQVWYLPSIDASQPATKRFRVELVDEAAQDAPQTD